MPAFVIDLSLRPPSWLWYIKLLAIMWNWSLLLMNFLISLPIVFRNTIGLNNLGKSYNDLLGFGITIVIEILKCKGQYSNSIQVFTIVIIFFRHILSLRMILRCLYNSLSRSGVDILLHLNKELVNSFSKSRAQGEDTNDPSSFKISLSILQYWTMLKVECKAC